MLQAAFDDCKDDKLNREFDALCDVSLEDGRKAFWELREMARQNGLQDMSLKEINAEIQTVRSEAD